jgi:hypothetical protein
LRTLVVHYHIFKNAGCSVDSILEATFGNRWASLEGSTPTSLLRPSDLSVFVKDHPKVVAISSHLLRPPAPMDLLVLPVALIRHPLDRAFSVYSHLRRSPVNGQQNGAIAQQVSFSQFIQWCLDHKSLGGMVVANYQVIHLSPASFRSGHIFNASATEDDLRHAISYLSDGTCFGTVDRFDAAMARLRLKAGKIGLPIATTSATENTTSGRPHSLDERVSIARQELGPVLYSLYLRENELDYRLYEWACLQSVDDHGVIQGGVPPLRWTR